jgi:uncharacterized protein
MEISRHWRIRKQRYSMVGGVCPNCEMKMFPMRDICPNCGHGSQVELITNAHESLFAQPVAVLSSAISG